MGLAYFIDDMTQESMLTNTTSLDRRLPEKLHLNPDTQCSPIELPVCVGYAQYGLLSGCVDFTYKYVENSILNSKKSQL